MQEQEEQQESRTRLEQELGEEGDRLVEGRYRRKGQEQEMQEEPNLHSSAQAH